MSAIAPPLLRLYKATTQLLRDTRDPDEARFALHAALGLVVAETARPKPPSEVPGVMEVMRCLE